MPSSVDITELLVRARNGDAHARDVLIGATYDELRRLARACLANERPDHTLQATELVNEAYARLLGGQDLQGENRVQFLAYVAQAMRRILINHARDRARVKRGRGRAKVQLHASVVVRGTPAVDLLALDEALDRLAQVAPRKSQVVELRYFGGLTVDEVAQALNISPRTVDRDWETAGTLLRHDLDGEMSDGA